MATRIIGALESLQLNTANPRDWIERFDLFAAANQLLGAIPVLQEDNGNQEAVNVANKANTAVFLSHVDAKVYSLLKSLCNPDNVIDKTIKELQDTYINHVDHQVSAKIPVLGA